ncbi:MAG: carboxy terminal-processing peptidase [Victivallales bacterium]|jgi:carboxyl-terminal processing protease
MSNMKYFSRFLGITALSACIFLAATGGRAVEPNKDQGTVARITANIFSKEHYRRHFLDNEISKQLFDEYFKMLDPAKLYLTQEDIKVFEKYRTELGGMLLDGNATFAFAVYNYLLLKAEDCRNMAEEIIREKLDFNTDETYTVDRTKAQWPANAKEQRDLWRLKIKNDIVSFRLIERAAKEAAEEQKNKTEAEVKGKDASLIQKWDKGTPEERVMRRINNNLKYLKENEAIDVLELYLSALANVYDPHSGYMSPRTVDDFNIQMKLSLVGIGATLTTEDGYTKIISIVPGGPADLDGKLKAEDRIIAVAQENGEPVDVIDMPLTKVVKMIRGKKDTTVKLTVMKGDKGMHAIPEIIAIKRDTVKLTEQEAKSEIRKVKTEDGTELKVGVLTLPSFYLDFDGASSGKENFKSSTNDVKKILADFNREKIDGLLLDLRSNGGGSLFEAVSLTGLFIKRGPVVQVRNQNGSVEIKNDPDRNICYDGPMVVLVNRLSASAAEIFAGAIQDYGRGIIIGDMHTHGKGTVQTIFDLDTFLRHYGVKSPSGSVKITTSKFYRINGESTQNKGVRPDIIFPSFTDAMEIGEEYLDHSLPWDTITPVKYEAFSDTGKSIPALNEKSVKRRHSENEFKILETNIERFRKMRENKTVTLNEEKRWNLYKEEKKISEQQFSLMKLDDPMLDDDAPAKNKSKKTDKDIFLQESSKILGDYIALLSSQNKAAAINTK